MNNFNFSERTSVKLQTLINHLYSSGERLRFWFGDTVTGKAWAEEHEIIGFIGKSTGIKPIPLLINNSRSLGGGGLLDGSIIRIDRIQGKRTIYQHENFDHGVSVSGCQVLVFGVIHANCETEQKAQRLADFLTGKRYSK
jgi:hypothetical protein